MAAIVATALQGVRSSRDRRGYRIARYFLLLLSLYLMIAGPCVCSQHLARSLFHSGFSICVEGAGESGWSDFRVV